MEVEEEERRRRVARVAERISWADEATSFIFGCMILDPVCMRDFVCVC